MTLAPTRPWSQGRRRRKVVPGTGPSGPLSYPYEVGYPGTWLMDGVRFSTETWSCPPAVVALTWGKAVCSYPRSPSGRRTAVGCEGDRGLPNRYSVGPEPWRGRASGSED